MKISNLDVYFKLKTIIYGINRNVDLSDDSALLRGKIFDSLELIKFLMKIEEEFNYKIDIATYTHEKLDYISNLSEFLSKRQEA